MVSYIGRIHTASIGVSYLHFRYLKMLVPWRNRGLTDRFSWKEKPVRRWSCCALWPVAVGHLCWVSHICSRHLPFTRCWWWWCFCIGFGHGSTYTCSCKYISSSISFYLDIDIMRNIHMHRDVCVLLFLLGWLLNLQGLTRLDDWTIGHFNVMLCQR